MKPIYVILTSRCESHKLLMTSVHYKELILPVV